MEAVVLSGHGCVASLWILLALQPFLRGDDVAVLVPNGELAPGELRVFSGQGTNGHAVDGRIDGPVADDLDPTVGGVACHIADDLPVPHEELQIVHHDESQALPLTSGEKPTLKIQAIRLVVANKPARDSCFQFVGWSTVAQPDLRGRPWFPEHDPELALRVSALDLEVEHERRLLQWLERDNPWLFDLRHYAFLRPGDWKRAGQELPISEAGNWDFGDGITLQAFPPETYASAGAWSEDKADADGDERQAHDGDRDPSRFTLRSDSTEVAGEFSRRCLSALGPKIQGLFADAR